MTAAGDLDRAIELGQQALAMSKSLGEIWARGFALNYLGQATWLAGDRPSGEALAREAAVCKHALDDRNGLAIVLETLAWMAAELSQHERPACLLGAAERFVGGRFDDVRLVGGGARSHLWCQVLADATDRTIVRVTDPWLAGLRGAALFAAHALGALRKDEIRGLVPTDPPFRPQAEHRATYDALAVELRKLYAAQKGFFRRSAGHGGR